MSVVAHATFSVGFAAKVIATFDDDDEKDANSKRW